MGAPENSKNRYFYNGIRGQRCFYCATKSADQAILFLPARRRPDITNVKIVISSPVTGELEQERTEKTEGRDSLFSLLPPVQTG
jgi:hypothetical protein